MNSWELQPLVSCLCLTKKRTHHLRRAVECFLAQTYTNIELIVVHPKKDIATFELLESFNDPRIRSIALELPKTTLGELRNQSIDHARGEYLTVWDDDDWYSPDRIKQQYLALKHSKKSASILTNLILYDSTRQKAYLSYERLWENSVFYEKKAIMSRSIRYPRLNNDEDYFFVNMLIANNMVFPVHDATLYIYNGTGSNTVGASHFDSLIARSAPLDGFQESIVQKCIEREMAPRAALAQMQGDAFRSSLGYVLPREMRE
jgi:glycosyltransferase involved in cell wall biosynthesis